MKIKSTLLVVLIILINCNCTKNKYVYYIKDSIKPWSYFKQGSYWIFYNENTKSLDSNYINKKEDILIQPDSPPQYEHIYINISSNFINHYTIFRNSDDSYLELGYLNVLSASIIEGSSSIISTTCRLINVFDVLTINGNNFKNVIQTQNTSIYNQDTTITNYYFVKNIGLVKKEINYLNMDSISTRSLIRWHVVQ